MAGVYPEGLQDRSLTVSLPSRMNKEAVKTFCAAHGQVDHVQVTLDKDKKYVAYVVMDSMEHAEALATIETPKISGKAVSISYSTNVEFQDLVLGLPVGFGMPPEEKAAYQTLAKLKTFGITGKSVGDDSEGHVKVIQNVPKVTYFYGSEKKSEVSYKLWKHEVRILLKDDNYTDETKALAIRKSLRGQAGNRILHLPDEASPEDIITVLDSIYEDALAKEQLLSQFYSAKQTGTEDAADWSVRLENIMDRAIEKGVSLSGGKNQMLCQKFFNGLREKDLKVAARHLYDQSSDDFQTFRTEVRVLEQELVDDGVIKAKLDAADSKPKSVVTKAQTVSSGDGVLDAIHRLEARMDDFDKRLTSISSNKKFYRKKGKKNKQTDSQNTHDKNNPSSAPDGQQQVQSN